MIYVKQHHFKMANKMKIEKGGESFKNVLS